MIDQKVIVSGLRKDLGLDEASTLNEAYVALEKQYNLPTEFLSAKAKAAHKELYQKYIANLNRISAELDALEPDNFSRYYELKGREIFNLNAVHLHELFFANISDVHSQISMDTLSFMRLERDFGTFDEWQYDFVANAMSPSSGWAVTAYSTFLQRYINFFVESHNASIPLGCYPIIVLDVWEHAYFRDYLTDRKAYIYAMMKELNWLVIEERIKKADKIAGVLR